MRRFKKQILLLAKKAVQGRVGKKPPKRFIHKNVPYFSQWESPELVEQFITKKLSARDDPKWRQSGAANAKEYETWSWNGCGMACLKMILAPEGNPQKLVQLGERSLAYGVYSIPLDDSPGMFYKPFTHYIKEEFRLDSRTISSLTLHEIQLAISRGYFVIASVSPEIRDPEKIPTARGGHLVLIYGYDNKDETFILHNPSGFKGSQERVKLTYAVFSRFFDHKGIVIRPAA